MGCTERQPSGTEGLVLNPVQKRKELGRIDGLKLFSSDSSSWGRV